MQVRETTRLIKRKEEENREERGEGSKSGCKSNIERREESTVCAALPQRHVLVLSGRK